MPFKPLQKYTVLAGDDLVMQAMDLPASDMYFHDVDVPSAAIAINTCSTQNWDVSEIFPDLADKLMSTSPNSFVTSEYTSPLMAARDSSAGPACSSKAVPDNVRLRNHDCMWSGRCNQQESHQKMKMKAAAAAAAAAKSQIGQRQQQLTPAQSPTKVRTIQAGESLLRFKQPSSGGQSAKSPSPSSGSSCSSDENNNNRPDTPQSLGDGEDQQQQDITCTTTGSNQLPLLSKEAATREHEVNKIKEYLSDQSTKQYKAYDNSTTLADVMNTLESGEFKCRDSAYPMSPADDDESDCRSPHEDDTESEHEMDLDGYGLNGDDDEGISLKMMPTSHLSSRASRLGFHHLQQQQQQQHRRSTMTTHSDEDEEDEDDDEDEATTSDEEDVKPDVSTLSATITTSMGKGLFAELDEEEDSGTERSLYGTSLTAQEKNLIKQQSSMHSDHCYTRVKSRVDIKNLGVETPSDSEEEIDVVGVGEKNLPTNPSAKDRKALQATVRNRFVRSTPGGILSAPPTGPNSGTTTPGGRSSMYCNNNNNNNSSSIGNSNSYGTPKKASHKQQQRQYSKYGGGDIMYGEELTESSNCSISSSGRKITPPASSMRCTSSSKSSTARKRPAASSVGSMGYSKGSKHYHDSKKSKYSGSGSKVGSRPVQKSYVSSDYRGSSMTTFTLEKRNLHNDLERQRRVGLKNLFEELKCQIPSLRDKERAPKVSILREAANLCTELSREQETLFALRKQRDRLHQTVRMLKTQLQRSAVRAK